MTTQLVVRKDHAAREKISIGKRLREITRERYGEKGVPQIAKLLKVAARTWYNYENGVTVPAEILLHFMELTNIEPNWLLYGEGNKYKSSQRPAEVQGRFPWYNKRLDKFIAATEAGSPSEQFRLLDELRAEEGDVGHAFQRFFYASDAADRVAVAALLRMLLDHQSQLIIPRYQSAKQFHHDVITLNPMPLKQAESAREQTDTERRLEEIVDRIDEFRSDVKVDVEAGLNDYIRDQRPVSATDKGRIAARVNSILERLGFVLSYSGRPSYLYVTSGKKDHNGRFRLVTITSREHLASTVRLSDLLPFTLTDQAAVQ